LRRQGHRSLGGIRVEAHLHPRQGGLRRSQGPDDGGVVRTETLTRHTISHAADAPGRGGGCAGDCRPTSAPSTSRRLARRCFPAGCDAWRLSRIDVVEGTRTLHPVALARVLDTDLAKKHIDEINGDDVAATVAALVEKGYKRETIKKSVTFLAMVLDHHKIAPNPARGVKLPDRDLEAPLFPGLTDARLRKAITKACKATGTPHFSPHSLRRRRGSLHYKRTGSLAEVAVLLGDSKRIAGEHYVYALTDYKEVDRSIALARALVRDD
jgi:integrase